MELTFGWIGELSKQVMANLNIKKKKKEYEKLISLFPPFILHSPSPRKNQKKKKHKTINIYIQIIPSRELASRSRGF
jgi:hypothetical protein